MLELIVVLCLAGEPDRCVIGYQVTQDCYRSYVTAKAAAHSKGFTVTRGITCRRVPDMELKPMTITPSDPPAKPKRKELST